ncbi:MAG: hydrogenase iron-sulfur subunit [Anaerolineales bacterium]|nr:hydrogenase iron-sulfur subunit [Anaerolineales bacterium]
MDGDCHYLEGNINAQRRVEFAGKLLEEIGLEGRRVQMVNVSAAMGAQFATSAIELTEEIRQIGPNPLRNIETKE